MESTENVMTIAEGKNKILLILKTCVTIRIIQNTFSESHSFLLK